MSLKPPHFQRKNEFWKSKHNKLAQSPFTRLVENAKNQKIDYPLGEYEDHLGKSLANGSTALHKEKNNFLYWRCERA